MKKLLLLLLLPAAIGASVINCKAQIGVGTSFRGSSAGTFEQGNIDRLKASTLIYIVRESENDKIAELQKVYEKAWTFCPIKLIKLSEYPDYLGKKEYSFLTVDGYMKEKTTSTYTSQHCFYYLNLWMVNEEKPAKKNDEINKVPFARVELHLRGESRGGVESFDEKKWAKEMFNFLYKKETIVPNWNPGFVKCYLQTLSNTLAKGKTRWMYENVKNTAETAKYKSGTLYCPEYVLNETYKKPPTEIFKKYPYKYKVIPDAELSDLILTSEKPIYFLHYIVTPYENYVGVINSKTGEIVYNSYNPANFVIKDKHLKEAAE